MTEIAFHFNAPDKWVHICRVVRKALRQDARIVIAGDRKALLRLDRMLWFLEPSDFVAHCLEDAAADVVEASPVLLTETPLACSHRQVLINAGEGVPEGFAEFARVIEVVPQADPQERAQARQRWRQYQAGGFAIVRHDLVGGARE